MSFDVSSYRKSRVNSLSVPRKISQDTQMIKKDISCVSTRTSGVSLPKIEDYVVPEEQLEQVRVAVRCRPINQTSILNVSKGAV
jgi:hypothetical protein